MPCCPPTQWRGYRPSQDPPAPAPGTVGGPASVVPPATVLAALETDLAGKVAILASDPKDRLAAALARLEKHSLYSQFILQHMH